MLSDECGKLSLEITKEGVVIVGKTIEALLGLLSAAGQGSVALGKDAWEHGKNTVEYFRAGETEISNMYRKGEPLESKEFNAILKDEKWRKVFDEYARTNKLEYAIIKSPDENAEGGVRYRILFKKSDIYKVEDAIAKTLNDMTEYKGTEEVYGKEVADSIDFSKVDLLTPEEKQRIYDVVKQGFSKESQEQNPKWDNEKVWDDAWKATDFEDKKDIFKEEFKIDGLDFEAKKKDIFLFHLTQEIKKTFGEDKLNENFLHVKDRGIVYLDAANKLHYINLGDKTHAFTILADKESITEMKEVLAKTNAKLRGFDLLVDSKYKDHSPEQKEFLKEAMVDSMEHPNINISAFDDKNFGVDKMAAIQYCQVELQDISDLNKILEHDFSAEQIYVLKHALLNGIYKECIFDPEKSPMEMKAMIEVIEKNPFAKEEEILKAGNEAKLMQSDVQHELFGGTVEKEDKGRTSLDDTLLDVKVKRSIEHVERSSEKVLNPNLTDTQQFAKYWYVAPVVHTENNCDWKEIQSSKNSLWFVNQQKEVKVLVADESYNPNGEEFNKLWKDGKSLYVDKNGMTWKSVRETPKGRMLLNEKGKSFVQRKENFTVTDLQKMKEQQQQAQDLYKQKHLSAPGKER